MTQDSGIRASPASTNRVSSSASPPQSRMSTTGVSSSPAASRTWAGLSRLRVILYTLFTLPAGLALAPGRGRRAGGPGGQVRNPGRVAGGGLERMRQREQVPVAAAAADQLQA